MDKEQQQNKQIQIKAKDDDLKVSYANLMQVSHTKEEFCLDFFNVFPPQGVLTARVIMSPAHLKRVIGALGENMHNYEEKFGQVEAAKPKESHLGFK